jgi:low affinity Fe/Cu permease
VFAAPVLFGTDLAPVALRLAEAAQTAEDRQPMATTHPTGHDTLPIHHSRLAAINRPLERLAVSTTNWVGSSWAFVIAAILTLAWLISGPFFQYSNTWQLVMNTISSILTFLMVFLLQRSQNKEFLAMQVKLNELLAAIKGASNRLINIEDLSEEEVRELHERYHKLMERASSGSLRGWLSIEEAVHQQERAGEAARPGP